MKNSRGGVTSQKKDDDKVTKDPHARDHTLCIRPGSLYDVFFFGIHAYCPQSTMILQTWRQSGGTLSKDISRDVLSKS